MGREVNTEVITNDQLAAALKLAIFQGLGATEVAEKLGISNRQALQRLMAKSPHYVAHRKMIKAKFVEDKIKVLAMGRTGYDSTVIARELGLHRPTVNSWLLEAGIDRSIAGSDDLFCPACTGVMKKQELFFWKCDSCGSEWWPKEAPDNPDDWARPWRIRFEDGKEMLGIATRLHKEGYTYQKICDEINGRGLKSPSGNDWTRSTISQYLRRRGLTSEGGDRTRIETIVRTMAEKGYYSKDIALRLNSEELTTSKDKDWTSNGICQLCRGLGIKLKGSIAIHLEKIHLKSDLTIHPWRAADNVRYAKYKAWRREHDVPSL